VPAQAVHLFEPTGFGGIFQHSCAVGEILTAAGWEVTLHTSAQHEPVDLPGVRICTCVWWPRDRPRGALRNPLIAARFAARTLPHLHRALAPGTILHVEGGVVSGLLTALTLAVVDQRRCAVVYSPHNTFSRRGRLDRLVLRLCLLFAQSSVAYSQIDVAMLRSRGMHATLSPLVQLVPAPEPERVARWRAAWDAQAGEQVVLFAGDIRPDKRLDLLVRAAADWPPERRVAVVGRDRNHLRECRELARELGVELHAHDEFVALEDFTAALAAADVVVAPYDRASQSGVLSVAGQLGTPTVAAQVGGLAELADRTFAPGDPAALTQAVEAELASGGRGDRALDDAAALAAHEDAYVHVRAVRDPDAWRERRRRRPDVAFVVWGPIEGRAEEFAAALGGDRATFFDLGILDRRLIPLRYALSALRTGWYLARTRPRSLIVANPPIFAALVGFLYARVARVPFVLDSHPMSFGQKQARLGRLFLPVHAALARRATTTLVGSDQLAARVRAWGGQADIVHEAPPPHTPAAALTSRGEQPYVLWSGIFAADEPFRAVIEAARLMPELQLWVAGDLRRCPVDPASAPANVRWLGFLRGEDYRRVLHGADAVLALTNDSTSAMRAAAEAIYAGKPLVTSDLEHLAELFPGSVRVRNESAEIAAGVRRAVAEREALAAASAEMRAIQLARWERQCARLRERLGLARREPPAGVGAPAGNGRVPAAAREATP
jgi:glycosyltransferase involved in cell wall biosynthesis